MYLYLPGYVQARHLESDITHFSCRGTIFTHYLFTNDRMTRNYSGVFTLMFVSLPTIYYIMTLKLVLYWTYPLSIHNGNDRFSQCHSYQTLLHPLIISITTAMKSSTSPPPIALGKRDVSAADALLSLSCRHNNLADSSRKIHLPSIAGIYQKRDARRVDMILRDGVLPLIKWSVVKKDFQFSLSQFFHRQLKVSFVLVPTVGESIYVNVDTKMLQESSDAVIVHGKHLVYVAVLSESLCLEAHLLAQRELGVSPVLSEQVIEGIKNAGKNDNELSWPPHSANFGVTLRPQISTRDSLNSQTQSTDAAIGSIREGFVKTSACSFQHTFVPVVRPIYDNEFFPVFLRPLAEEDDFYGERPAKKMKRVPRFKSNFVERDKMHLPCPLKSSIPPCHDTVKNAVADFENRIRTISEWLLSEIFFVLPYGTTAFQAANDFNAACVYALKKGITFPCASLCRPLPKGTLGMYPSKALHDDGNSCIIPSVWQSVVGHEKFYMGYTETVWHVFQNPIFFFLIS
jgi:hypothetical protein